MKEFDFLGVTSTLLSILQTNAIKANVCENFSLFDVISNKPSWFTSNMIFMNAIVETRTLKRENFLLGICCP